LVLIVRYSIENCSKQKNKQQFQRKKSRTQILSQKLNVRCWTFGSGLCRIFCALSGASMSRTQLLAALPASPINSVSHAHLIRKLDQSGIKGPLLHWFIGYLGNRLQCVVTSGVHRVLSLACFICVICKRYAKCVIPLKYIGFLC